MKEFNLEAALNGEPVKLACGRKAYILYDLSKYPELLKHANRRPLNGLVMSDCEENDCYPANWLLDGKNLFDQDDIVGMFEEPKLTSEQVLEKAYQENLPLDAIGKKAFVIAKTKDGDYVMQCGEDNLYLASHKIEWEFYKDPAPKSDTITVNLSKPFKPDIGDEFFYLSVGTVQYCSFYSDINADLMRGGQCFREREDAQKWLDFMKSMME